MSMSNNQSKIIINNQVANRHTAYEALSQTVKEYSSRVAYNARLLFLKAIDKGIYSDYNDLDIKYAEDIFEIFKLFDVGYAFEGGENVYSGTALPMQHIELGSQVFFSDVKTKEDFKNLDAKEKFIRRAAKEVCYYHHERWDGHGFPEGLRMEETPLLARIVAICYGFENLTYSNSKQIRLSKNEALRNIASEVGKAYDPLLVQLFVTLENELVVYGDEVKEEYEPKVKKVEKQEKEPKVQKEKVPKEKASKQTKKKKTEVKKKEKHKPIEMLYHPIVDISKRKIVYYQSEIVLYDQYVGELHPVVYFSLAEKTGQIVDITLMGLKKILKVISSLPKRGRKLERISLRISKVHLAKPTFLAKVEKIIQQSNVSPERLIFEIPEEVLESADQQILERVARLRELGIKIALVEFGFGYSSISSISDIDFDIVIIDKKYVESITTNTRKCGVFRSLVEMVERLDAEVICQGVENQAQKDIIMKCGCSKMQGSLIGKPLDTEKILTKYVTPSKKKK
jgi:EAL domain-containing protein (putative c-di-GMP-specific phosphodiesterase class I)